MFLSLADNALDSIQYGLRSYKQFLSLPNKHLDNNPTHLKVAILMIHNGVELVLKHYLSSLNELLIYDLKDDKNKELFFNAYSIILDKSSLVTALGFASVNTSFNAAFKISSIDSSNSPISTPCLVSVVGIIRFF